MWPDDGTSLPVEVAAAFGSDVSTNPAGWVWTDLSSRIRGDITGRGGRSSGARNASPASYTVELDNDDGALTPLHPMSVYWPYVRLGTPVRIRVFWGGVWYTRILGSADAWAPTFQPLTDGTTASRVRLTVSGPLRRIEQGSDPRPSTPRQYIPTTNPVAYWPLEDGQLVSEGAAAVGGYAMRPFVGTHPSGAVVTFSQWGRGDLAPWLPEVVSRAGNAGLTAIWSPVEGAALYTSTRWVVDFMYRSGTDAADSVVDVNPSYLGGGLGWPQLLLLPSVQGVDVTLNGEPEVNGTAPTLFDGQPHHIRWDVYQNGAKVSWNVYVDGVMVNFGTTTANLTLPIMQTIALVSSAQQGADMAQGHLAVWAPTPPPVQDAVYAAFGYSGETAAARVTRLCGEAGIPVTVGAGDSEPLGPQRPDTLVELLREAETADMGVLYEDGVGLGYRPRGDRYNAPVDLTINLATYQTSAGTGSEVLVPVYDDQSLRNRWTVSRPDGRSVTVEDTAHQQRSGGIRPDSVELNLPNDTRLADHASWRLYLGTVDAVREASFPIDLAANPALIAGWLGLKAGARIVRQNPPASFGPSPLDTFMDGWSERIGPQSWTAQVNPSPAGPWDVATADGNQRAGADGSTLAATLSSSGTLLVLASTQQNGVWTTDPADFPLDLRVGGERVTASGIFPAVSDAFSRTVANGWGSANSGQAWTTTGGSASDYSVSGGVGQHSQGSVGALRQSFATPGGSQDFAAVADVTIPVMPAGGGITAWLVVRAVDPSNYYTAQLGIAVGGSTSLTLYKRVSGSLSMLGSGVTVGTHAAGTTWRISVAAYGSSLMAKAWIPAAGVEPGWQVLATDSALATGTQVGVLTRLETGNTNTLPVVIAVDNLAVTNPQSVTISARGVNGVQRAWPAGTEVDVWQPAIAAL